MCECEICGEQLECGVLNVATHLETCTGVYPKQRRRKINITIGAVGLAIWKAAIESIMGIPKHDRNDTLSAKQDYLNNLKK